MAKADRCRDRKTKDRDKNKCGQRQRQEKSTEGAKAKVDRGSENDLYASYSISDYSITITDYYFPGASPSGNFNETASDTGAHNIELSLGGSFSGIGLTAAAFVVEPGFYGAFDTDKAPMSKYINISYGPFMLGFGDGGYTSDGKFAPIEVGVSASNEKYSCSWILNPDSGLAFLVVGKSF